MTGGGTRGLALSLALAASVVTSVTPAAAGSAPHGATTAAPIWSAPDGATDRVLARTGVRHPWIVRLRDGIAGGASTAIGDVAAAHRLTPSRTYRSALRGFVAPLTPVEVRGLQRDPRVAGLMPDLPVTLEQQHAPTGVRRSGTLRSPAARIDGIDERVNVDVAVVDTGIERGRADLVVAGGRSCVPGTAPSAWDDAGEHGTHVAGIVGARDDWGGVVGVAPGARLWAVRVFDDTERGYISWILCGIDWVTAQRDPADPSRPRIEVVNMSLSLAGRDDGACGSRSGDAWHAAICRSVASGITYVVAAGNQGTEAASRVPAAYEEVITVGALADFDGLPGSLAPSICSSFRSADADDTYADFSNYGPDVDLIAPGKCILSSAPPRTLRLSSGTSMAAPHVAGAAALFRALHPGTPPSAVRRALVAAGSMDWDVGSDPDGLPQPMLDASGIGRGPDVSLAPTATLAFPAGGGSADLPIRLVRRDGFDREVRLSIGDLPPGAVAVLDPPTLPQHQVETVLRLDIPAGQAPHRSSLRIQATAPATASSAAVARELLVPLRVGVPDDIAPSVRGPVAAFASGRQLQVAAGGHPSVPLDVRWSGGDDRPGSVRWTVERRTGSAGWQPLPRTDPTLLLAVDAVPLGADRMHRVHALDAAGNRATVAGSTVRVAGAQETAAAVTYAGSWGSASSGGAWGNRTRASTSRGAVARFAFTGRAVAWIATTARDRGLASVRIDGVTVAEVDLRTSTRSDRVVVFARALAPGNHTLEVVNLATAGRPRIEIDGFLVIP